MSSPVERIPGERRRPTGAEVMQRISKFSEDVTDKPIFNPILVTGIFALFLVIILILLIFGGADYSKWPLITSLFSLTFSYILYLSTTHEVKRNRARLT